MADAAKTGRRKLLKVLGIHAFAGAMASTRRAEAIGTRIDKTFPRKHIGRLSELRKMEPTTFDYPDEGAFNLLVALPSACRSGVGPEQNIVAYNTICPHMGCPIEAKVEESGMLSPCRCHFSCFDLADDGLLVQGQATQSLPRILLEVDGDDIYAVGVSGLIYGRHDNLRTG